MFNNIQYATEVLKKGGLVAFPTETVYGLGADATNEQAISKVFAVKGRPQNHPLIVHIANLQQLNIWATNITKDVITLAKYFWPGPLTLVLAKKATVSNLITGNQDTIALRIPQHPLTLKMLQEFGGGIVGPSANTYGRLSPTTAAHVYNDLGDQVDYILDGGPCTVGIESTIVYINNEQLHILRQGSITANDIYNVLGKNKVNITETTSAIQMPGMIKTHYTPKNPVFLVTTTELSSVVQIMLTRGLKYNYLCLQECPIKPNNFIWQQMPKQAAAYAKNLYAALHSLDTPDIQGIIIERPPQHPSWAAILDRLTRASSGNLSLQTIMTE